MKQSDLDRAVANATGESVSTISQLGFLLADPQEAFGGDSYDDGPDVIDWDMLHASRNEPRTRRRTYEPVCA
jgi:hypothetical protein